MKTTHFPIYHVDEEYRVNQIDSLQELKYLYDDISGSKVQWPADMSERDIYKYIINENNFDDHHLFTDFNSAISFAVEQNKQGE